jgi:Mrp family chromosome partitioning ATPase
VWLWPPPLRQKVSQKIEFFRPAESNRETGGVENWLDALRRDFDAVILDCPGVEGSPGVTEVAAMADAAVLAVEAGHTSAEQLRHCQQALQFRGTRVVGCILVRPNQGG